MKTMTARDAKTHFGEFLDAMQREPVIEMFMEKETGYDAWFQAKVTQTRDALASSKTQVTAHDEAMERVWERVQAKARPADA